jgi:hypothetical protein
MQRGAEQQAKGGEPDDEEDKDEKEEDHQKNCAAAGVDGARAQRDLMSTCTDCLRDDSYLGFLRAS